MQDLAGIAIGNDQQIAMKVGRGFGLAGRAGSKAEQGDIVGRSGHRGESARFFQRHPVEFGVVVGGAVKTHHPLQHGTGVRRAGLKFIEQAGVT